MDGLTNVKFVKTIIKNDPVLTSVFHDTKFIGLIHVLKILYFNHNS